MDTVSPLHIYLRNETPVSVCDRSCLDKPEPLQPNPDIGGIGVMIGFVGTGWLVVILMCLRYCLAFDPSVDPLQLRKQRQGHKRKHVWKPNVIDVQATNMFSSLRRRLGNHPRWGFAITKVLLNLCDIQLLTGFGILLSSFVSLGCYMSAYHWQIICYLIWFSSVTHAACLSALRTYLSQHRTERNYRLVLMAILLAGLITALVPTGYFNWAASREDIGKEETASLPSSNARCFFSRKMAQTIWDHSEYKKSKVNESRPVRVKLSVATITSTTAYETFVTSLLMLILGFFSRVLKGFRRTSEFTKYLLREKLGYWAIFYLMATANGCKRFGTTPFRRKLLAIFRPLDLMIATYLVAKIYLEAIVSELADLLWLVLSSIWGTLRLFIARFDSDIGDSDDAWSFGQVLPVFLLLGPLMAAVMTLLHAPATEIHDQPRISEDDKKLVLQVLRSLDTHPCPTGAKWASIKGKYKNMPANNGVDTTARPGLDPDTQNLHAISAIFREIENYRQIGSPRDAATLGRNNAEASPPNETHGVASINEAMAPSANERSLATPFALNEEILPRLNQDIALASEHILWRESLRSYVATSRWITLVFWFIWFQFLASTWNTLVYLSANAKPTMVLGMFATLSFTQPFHCFVGVVVGIYVDDRRISKLRLAMFSVLLWILLGWSIFTTLWNPLPYRFLPLCLLILFLAYLSCRS